MAPRVTPAAPPAENACGRFTPAASNDWRRADADSMSARALITQPTSDAGYATAGSSLGALHRSISHWRWRGSPYRRGWASTSQHGLIAATCMPERENAKLGRRCLVVDEVANPTQVQAPNTGSARTCVLGADSRLLRQECHGFPKSHWQWRPAQRADLRPTNRPHCGLDLLLGRRS